MRGKQSKFEKLEFLRKVRELFLSLAYEDPERFIIIDASRFPESIEKEVTEKVLEFLRRK
jgi:dTMP kinase